MNKDIFTILKLFILVILCGSIVSCTTTYNNSKQMRGPEYGMPSEPGKCYAKCLIQDEYEVTLDSFAIYSNIENVDYTVEQITIETGESKWVKKKADKNCLSKDPNDCLVWCLVSTEEVLGEVKIPADPSLAGDVSYQVYEKKKLIKKGGMTEWREVVCADGITSDLIARVQNALIREGYNVGEAGANNKFGKETKTALVKFQRDNSLPVGQLDYETLKGLGIQHGSI